MTLTVEREIANVQHDRDIEAKRKPPNAEYLARLDARLAELRDEQEVDDLGREIVLAAAEIHNRQVEERKRQEEQP